MIIGSEGRRRPFSSFGRRGVVLRRFAEGEEGEEEQEKKDHQVDLSGMALESLPVASLNLATITRLDLSNNNLESIPESLTARLLSVVVLDLHSNLLQALPFSIGCLSRLKILNISGNMLESLPKTIEDCKALEELIVNFNKLTALPDSIGFELTNLRKLGVGSNKLLALPSSLSHMTSLRILDARLNRLCSLPEDLENLSRLEVLDVSQNFRYLRRLPPSVGLLTSLLDLDISYNTISTLPESLAYLGKLRKLQAEGNPLVSPPVDVMERGVEAVRQYLTARMNADGNCKKSWIGKLVKCATFTQGMIRRDDVEDDLFVTSSPCRRIDGLASPRHVGMFSPRRLFSPRSSPSRN